MSKIFTKNSFRGFTLIELLVVIAIIGLLSTVIAGPVQTGLKKGRDARKIGDMKQVQSALAQYNADNGGLYPKSLDGLVPTYIGSTTLAMATTTIARDKIMYVVYTDGSGNIVSYHLGVPLENQNVVLNSDADCAGNGSWTAACANTSGKSYYSNVTATYPGAGNNVAATSTGGIVAGQEADFNGAGTAEGTTCTTLLSTCIYDIIPQ